MNGRNNSFVCAIRGPIILITIGVLFALNNFTTYRFDQTWPVILIVFGLLTVLRRGIYRPAPDGPRPWPNRPWPPETGSSGGSYRQSQYPATTSAPSPAEAGPVKGGFGTSAPPRPENSSVIERASDSGQDRPGGPPNSGGNA